VTLSKASDSNGTLRVRIARGTDVVALGHGRVRHGVATLTLRERRSVSGGAWTITLVLSRPGKGTVTITRKLRL
jgi:hypothetical protein